MRQEDPFVAAEKHDPGLSSERVERAAAPASTQRQQTPNPQLGARNESSVLFKLTDIQAAMSSAAASAEDVPIHLDASGAGSGRKARPTGFIELGHFEAPQSLASIVPIGLLQPRGATTYIPRWVWGLAAGGAALLIAVVGMTIYLVGAPMPAAPEVAATAPATASPTGARAALAAVAPPVKLAVAAPSKSAGASSTAPVARARAKHHGGKRSARRLARSSAKSSLPTSADVPAPPRARASGRDELDSILGGSVAH